MPRRKKTTLGEDGEMPEIPPRRTYRKRSRKDANEEDVTEKKEENNNNNWNELDKLHCFMKLNYGTEYNFFGYGGCGTYLILGPTDSGKSYLVKQAICIATCGTRRKKFRIGMTGYIIVSATAKNTKDWDFLPEELKVIRPDTEDIAQKKDEDFEAILNDILKSREEEIKEGAQSEELDETEYEEWAKRNPITVIFDDSYGKVNTTAPGNAVASLATKARHMGIYFLLLVQYVKQCGPPIRDNCRMIICLKSFEKDHRFLVDHYFGLAYNKDNQELKKHIVTHNQKNYNIVVYVHSWNLEKNDKFQARRIMKMNPIPDYHKDSYKKPDDSGVEIDSEDDLDSLDKKLGKLNSKITLL